jgi:hypothetical protein
MTTLPPFPAVMAMVAGEEQVDTGQRFEQDREYLERCFQFTDRSPFLPVHLRFLCAASMFNGVTLCDNIRAILRACANREGV